MGSYAKRRSTQRPSPSEIPRSPIFGYGEDGGTGGGGGTGEPEDDDESTRASTVSRNSPGISRQRSPGGATPSPGISRQRSPGGATPFDERVKSVRSRIREMVAGAGDDSSEDETFPPRRGSRGSKASSARTSATKVSATDDLDGASKAGSARNSATKVSATDDLDGASKAGSARTSASKVSVIDEVDGASKTSSARTSASKVSVTDDASFPPKELLDEGEIVGRDGMPYVGAKVRILDPRIARYVEPTGTVVEVRCEGQRVRVEHDGNEKAQRYYNTGKNDEYQLMFEEGMVSGPSSTPRKISKLPPKVKEESESSDEGPPAATRKPNAKTVPKPRVSRATLESFDDELVAAAPKPRAKPKPKRASRIGGGSRTSKVAAETKETEQIIEPDTLEINAANQTSRYSQLRAKRLSEAVSEVAGTSAPAAKAADDEQKDMVDANEAARVQVMKDRKAMLEQHQKDLDAEKQKALIQAQIEAEEARAKIQQELEALEQRRKDLAAEREKDEKKDSLSVGGKDQSLQLDKLRKDHDDLSGRLRNLEQSFVKDLGTMKESLKDDMRRQMESMEKRIFARLFEEMEKRQHPPPHPAPPDDPGSIKGISAFDDGKGACTAPSDDGLDAEMARLAELRRFASSVLQAADVQNQLVSPSPASIHQSCHKSGNLPQCMSEKCLRGYECGLDPQHSQASQILNEFHPRFGTQEHRPDHFSTLQQHQMVANSHRGTINLECAAAANSMPLAAAGRFGPESMNIERASVLQGPLKDNVVTLNPYASRMETKRVSTAHIESNGVGHYDTLASHNLGSACEQEDVIPGTSRTNREQKKRSGKPGVLKSRQTDESRDCRRITF